MFYDIFSNLCIMHKTTPATVAKELEITNAAISKWRHGAAPRDFTLRKIADYFDVTVDYLLGKEQEKKPSENEDLEAIRVALFGGDAEVTPEMWEEVKRFARYVAAQKKQEKK